MQKKILLAGQAQASQRLRGTRRVTVIAIIVSVSVAAAVGIVTVLTGDFGETQAKVLGTTSLLAGLSITALCHLAIVGRNIRPVGFFGLAASVVAFAAGVILIWEILGTSVDVQNMVLKAFALAGVLAVFLAQANLLLLLSARKRRPIRVILIITLIAVAAVYILLAALILTDGDIAARFIDDLYVRTLAVSAILDALGTVVLPVLGLFIKDKQTGFIKVTLNLPDESAALLNAWTKDSGQTPEDVVGALLLLGRKVESE